MDREFKQEKRIGELIRQAEMARGRLGAKAANLRAKIDVFARLRSSLSGHPARWIAGSMFSGLAVSLLLRRRRSKSPPRSKGALLAVLLMLVTAAKPIAKAWMISRLKDILIRNARPAATIRPTAATRPVARPLS